MKTARPLLAGLAAAAALALLGGCGPGGGVYETDYYDAGPVGYWPGFYGRPWYGREGVYVSPPRGAGPGHGAAPHIPDRPRPQPAGGRGGAPSSHTGSRSDRR